MWDLGNVPCYIEKSAKLKTSVNDLVMSKSFDNGMICASEQAVIVDKEIAPEFERLMKEANCYFVNDEERAREHISDGAALYQQGVGELYRHSVAYAFAVQEYDMPDPVPAFILQGSHVDGFGLAFALQRNSLKLP